MAFPPVESVTPTNVDADSTPTYNFPATVNSGDLLIAIASSWENVASAVFTWPGTWTELADTCDPSGTETSISVAYRIAGAGEGGGSVTPTITLAADSTCHIYRISGWHGTTPPEVSTVSSFYFTAAPNPDALDPSGWATEETLWIAAAAWWDGNISMSSAPTNYTNLTESGTGATTADANLATARRENEVGSEDPGAFTLGSADYGHAITIAVRPSAGTVNTNSASGDGLSTTAVSMVVESSAGGRPNVIFEMAVG